MKKEIIVNANKDRSRIAIVEDGELVELYVEHPDNVRTLGNIYLARVRKVMPAIRAAFVDVGQKQDAFLHFSDLTDNLGELLAISGEDVPGHEARVLAHAPRKRVADDENEPDIEETLELEASEETEKSAPSRSRRSSRSRSSSRGRNRRGGRNPREEEEEQEEADKSVVGSPFVIDLTHKPDPAEPLQPRRSEKAEVDEESARTAPLEEEEKPAPISHIEQIDLTSGASSVKSTSGSVGECESEADREEAGNDDDSEESRPRRRGRRGGRHRARLEEESSDPDELEDEQDADETTAETDKGRLASRGERKQIRERRSTRGSTKSSEKKKVEDADSDDATEEAPRRERQPSRGERGQQRDKSSRGSGGKSSDGKDQSERSSRRTSSDPPLVRPEELLKRDQRLIVKVTKEPISSKGSRVSTDISFAGRFLVLVPAADYVAVSKKIESGRERRRLRTLATSLRPDGFGVIVRTVGEGRDAKTLDTDMRLLVEKWNKIESQLRARPAPPELLYEDVNMVSSIIRDLFTEDFDRILVDDPKLHRNITAYVGAVAPHMVDRVKLHRSNTPLYRAVGIERAVEQVFSSRVPLPSGGYLFIEHTEAMHVVDVNSGRAGKGKTQKENLLNVNLEAAKEIARQIRLRDLGGIIVIDFIDMWLESDRRKVYQAMKNEFKRDRAVTKLLPMSDFGIMQITRQRLRPSITAQENGDSADPASAMEAAGASEIMQPERDFGPQRLDEAISSDDPVRRLEAWLRNYQTTVPDRYRRRPVSVRVHPLFDAYLRRGVISQVRRWKWNIKGLNFEVIEDATMHPLDFEVRDKKSGKSLTARYEPETVN